MRGILNLSRLNILIGGVSLAIVAVVAGMIYGERVNLISHEQVYRAHAIFTNIGTLVEDSPVQFGGMIVGSVRRIKIIPDGRISVVVEMRLDQAIPEDSVLSINSTLITGDTFINVFRGKSRKMILPYSSATDENIHRASPELIAVNYMTIADAAGSFQSIGGIISDVLNNIAAIAGSGEKSLSNRLDKIAEGANQISEQAEIVRQNFSDAMEYARQLGGELKGISADYRQIRDRVGEAFPENASEKISADISAIGKNLTATEKIISASKPDREKISADIKLISDWKDQIAYSPRSVVGVLLTDPQYSAAATGREIERAYREMLAKPLLPKIGYFVGSFLRGRGVAKHFMRENFSNRDGRDDLAEFYREWQNHAYQQKNQYGYISR